MDLMLHAAEWLAWPLRVTEQNRVDDELLGMLALATADLEHQSTLVAPRAALWRELQAALRHLPPQWVHLSSDGPFARWLAIASLAESAGALRLATVLLHHLELAVRADHAGVRGGDAEGADLRERLALCWTRRGRIARTNGQLADAEAWYTQARRLVHSAPSRDGRPQAQLGLAALAVNRGNYPAVIRSLRRLTVQSAKVPALYRIPSHQLMAVARRKQRRFIDALLHVWAAFDLLDAVDFRREQLVGTMAEIALEADDLEAASNGFATVLHSNVGPLVRVPALFGAVRARIAVLERAGGALARDRRDPLLGDFAAELDAMQVSSLAPSEAVLAHLAAAELARHGGSAASAEAALDAAESLARAVGLFERLFTVEEFRARLRSSKREAASALSVSDPASSITRSHSGRAVAASRRHPALERLLSLR